MPAVVRPSRADPDTDHGRLKGEPKVLTALARGETAAAAARAAGVHERTVRRRLDDPAYRAEVARLRTELFGRAVGILASGAEGAAHALLRLTEEAEADHVVLQASKALLDLGPSLRDHVELVDRHEAVEAELAAIRAERSDPGPLRSVQ